MCAYNTTHIKEWTISTLENYSMAGDGNSERG